MKKGSKGKGGGKGGSEWAKGNQKPSGAKIVGSKAKTFGK